MSLINENNQTFTLDRQRLIHWAYHAPFANHHIDSGEGINIDLDHAIFIRPSRTIVVSLRSEASGLWKDITITGRAFYRLNVYDYDLMNIRAESEGSPAKVMLKSLNRSYTLDESFEANLDAASSAGSFRLLPKIIATAS